MPHLNVQYSADLTGNFEFEKLHQILERELPADIESCKTRFIPVEHYFVGTDPKKAFVAATLEIMQAESRTDEVLKRTSELLLELLKKAFDEFNEGRKIDYSVNCVFLHQTYTKG